jgi:hypothetical protein
VFPRYPIQLVWKILPGVVHLGWEGVRLLQRLCVLQVFHCLCQTLIYPVVLGADEGFVKQLQWAQVLG